MQTKGDLHRMVISGPLNEESSTDLIPIVDQIKFGCLINLKDLTSINSLGTMAWMRFMSLLGQKCQSIELEDCSVDFISQTNMISGFQGHARIISFYGQYFCDQCPHEETRFFRSSDILANSDHPESEITNTITCIKCGNSMDLSDESKTFVQRHLRKGLPLKKAS